MSIVGQIVLRGYRLAIRLRAKVFSLMISGAFARFGENTVLVLPLRVSGESRIELGDRVFIGAGSWLQTLPDDGNDSVAISIGSGSSIAGYCVISAVRRVSLEENVLLARNVYISDHIHQYDDPNVPVLAQGVGQIRAVTIGRGAWLGQNVVICPGVTIGKGAVIGANSVVKDDVPDFAVAVGAPARVIRTFQHPSVADD